MNSKEMWRQVVRGKRLQRLGLPSKDGRIDLRGSVAPAPSVGRTVSLPIAELVVLEGTTVIRGAVWESLDFSNSQLDSLRFFDCIIRNCVFDSSSCKDWRLWSTRISDTTFRSTDLRGSALGAVQDGKRNGYRNVDFGSADLRRTSYKSAEFNACTFGYSRLDKVDFEGSTFVDCTFEGELREVMFYREGFKGGAYPPNEMLGVDFSRAKLRWCALRGLDLDDVRFPHDDEHIVLNDCPEMLDRLLLALRGREDVGSKTMVAVFANERKWVGRRGVLNKEDLLEMAGEDGLKMVLKILSSGSVC